MFSFLYTTFVTGSPPVWLILADIFLFIYCFICIGKPVQVIKKTGKGKWTIFKL